MYRGDGAHSACATKLLVTPTAGTEELSQFNYRYGGVRVLREWSCSVCVNNFNGCTAAQSVPVLCLPGRSVSTTSKAASCWSDQYLIWVMWWCKCRIHLCLRGSSRVFQQWKKTHSNTSSREEPIILFAFGCEVSVKSHLFCNVFVTYSCICIVFSSCNALSSVSCHNMPDLKPNKPDMIVWLPQIALQNVKYIEHWDFSLLLSKLWGFPQGFLLLL